MRIRGRYTGNAGSIGTRPTATRLAAAARTCAVAVGLFALGLAAVPRPVGAQTADIVPPAPIDPFAATEIVDYREQMRTFVQSISAYARGLNPNFVVIAKDGLALAGKPDPLDLERLFPARAYMRAIDGVMETALLDETVTTPDGKPDPILEEAVKRRAADLERIKQMGLKVFDLEFATTAQDVSAAYSKAAAKGYIPFVAENEFLNTIPEHPRSAFQANPASIASASEVRNYLYVASSQQYGTTTDYIQALRNTNHDIVVVDVFSGRTPLTRQQVDLLKYKKLGARRLVLAQIDIASAASFHYYWQPGWGQGSPPFIYAPFREDPDRHRVIYWAPGWQAIITGGTNSYVYGVIDLGFDGVVLKGVDAWAFYETGGEQP